ncbi:MAG TPA: nuclear transport factor 2 family protein [Myxococcota bacterium]|nr:nuclear transport factor 2 family protein [Myxococcota bacterium]
MKVRPALILVALALAACSPKYLPNTEVPDTNENRAIVDLVERYRVAVEERDVAALREMVSRGYFSNAGTTSDAEDDYGYDQVEQLILPMLKQNIKKVQYGIFVKRVRFESPTRAVAEFEHSFRYLYVVDGKDQWQAKVDFASLTFALEDGVWRIVGGL